MKKLIIIIFLLASTICFAGDVVVSWNSNSEVDISGYLVYFGTDSTNLENSSRIYTGNVTKFRIAGLVTGIKYYFGIKAQDQNKNVSDMSEIVSHIAIKLSTVTCVKVESNSAELTY